MRRALFVALLAATLLCTASGGGGREIEGCLFVIAMAVDPAQDGNLTVTVKALSGTQEAAAPQESGQDDASDGGTPSAGQMETEWMDQMEYMLRIMEGLNEKHDT